jgi:arabinan endo-1,5-alpha-L-arabinosidase
LVLSLHQPNKGPLERTRLFLVGERPDGLPYVVGRLTEEAVPTACDGS